MSDLGAGQGRSRGRWLTSQVSWSSSLARLFFLKSHINAIYHDVVSAAGVLVIAGCADEIGLLNFEAWLLDAEEEGTKLTSIPDEFFDVIVMAGHEL